MKMIADRLLVRPDAPADTYRGIHLPSNATQLSVKGTVIAAGDGRWEGGRQTPMTVQQGDRVLFNPLTGAQVELKDEKLIVFNESQIIAVLESGDEQVLEATAGH